MSDGAWLPAQPGGGGCGGAPSFAPPPPASEEARSPAQVARQARRRR
eukprot:CAMPEP_0185386424 /NCGR_PEP_ID=MMETSP1364-20130426/64115_1 /TAXON_ID=38817 /ORGANISM="Gephyrocapsa oceanica, Strain RCC1303" /LENGTH=46 /DNA_ID= /DNA_START= /DNA_END= /DNA_ORIENTATION=